MKVIHVTNDLGASSGVATFVRRINAELKELGVDSSIVSTVGELDAASEAGLPDVVHIHGLWLPLHHRASVWARRRGVLVVWSTHGMTAPWAMRHKRWKKLPVWWAFQKRDLMSAALVHCTTDLEAGWNACLGLKRAVVVPLGTDLPETGGLAEHRGPVRPLGEEPAEDVQGMKAAGVRGGLRVLFVGRIYPVKGLDNLVRAAGLLKEAGMDLAFRLVGPDQDGHRAELEKLIRTLGLCNIAFTGALHDGALAREYAACDVLVLPSFSENFGGVVVDALAHGKPVIASQFTPWKVLEEKCCGWWVDNSPESLAATLRVVAGLSRDELAKMGRRGRSLVESSYTWGAVGRAMLDAYGTLIR